MKKKKILIIAPAQSSHTQSWIDLIDKKNFEVRLFGVQNTRPSEVSSLFYYTFNENFPFVNQKPKVNLFMKKAKKALYYFDRSKENFLEKYWLKKIILGWQPDIIHTLGLAPASWEFLPLSGHKVIQKIPWVVTIRGGSDIELERLDLAKQSAFGQLFQKCSYVFADNTVTYAYAYQLGLDKEKKPNWAFTPGTGGINISALSKLRKHKTSSSRIILWPKACEAPFSKGLPVLEAIKNVWSLITPCQIIMTVTDAEFLKWINMLPKEIRDCILVYDRVPRLKLLKFMAQARVVLLPSLVDGIPNSLYEAMACKTLAIISPLPTIRTVVGSKNVLFARNLYPDEIAAALKKAMTCNTLVDKIVSDNLPLVKRVADRKKIANQVNQFYREIS